MKGQLKAIVSGVIVTVIGGLLLTGVLAGGEKMTMHFMFEFLKYMSPLIAGGIVYLIVRNIQFFAELRGEQEKKFQSWLSDKEKELEQFRGTYNELLSGHVDDHLKRADRNLKTYRESYEKRLDKLEERCLPK